MKRYLEILIKYSNEDLYSIISHVWPEEGAQQDNGTERVNPQTIKKIT